MTLTYDQIRAYFEARLPGQRIGSRDKVAAKCPFHEDRSASMTLFLTGNGAANCHGCGFRGNVFQFEVRHSNCDFQTAERNVASITGAKASFLASGDRQTASYDFRLANGAIAFQKRRYVDSEGRKTFRIFRPNGHGWEAGIGNQPKVLYHLPEVVTANVVMVTEGEKDCETLDSLKLYADKPAVRIATTTNFAGAWQPGHSPKWDAENNAYFAGKRVLIFEDNDDAGRAWAAHIAAEVCPLAVNVKVVRLPGLAEKGDVSDWMESHTAEQLVEEIQNTQSWQLAEAEKPREVLVSAEAFLAGDHAAIDWLVDGIIERGSNGFLVANPKVGKSFLAVDLMLSMAAGVPWLGRNVPRPVRCALVSREDNYRTTQRRLERLLRGKGCNPGLVADNLYLNTGQQTTTLMIDNEAELNELIAEIKRREIEFAVLDVLNVLHDAEENDNTEMRGVLAKAKRIETEGGCAVGIVHHFNKNDSGSITTRMRGSSAISGFAEWIVGISMSDVETKTRRVEFEIKADQAPAPIFYTIANIGPSTFIEVVEGQEEPAKASRVFKQGRLHENIANWQDRG